MKLRVGHVAAAGAVVGLLSLGGLSYAYAQSSSTTPSTTPGSAPSDNSGGTHSNGNCPNMGGSGNSSAGTSSADM